MNAICFIIVWLMHGANCTLTKNFNDCFIGKFCRWVNGHIQNAVITKALIRIFAAKTFLIPAAHLRGSGYLCMIEAIIDFALKTSLIIVKCAKDLFSMF